MVSWALNLAIHWRFPCRVVCGNMHLIYMGSVPHICVQVIVRWQSVIVTKCFVIPMVGCASNTGSTWWKLHVSVTLLRFWSWLYFVHWYEEVEYEKDLPTRVQRLMGSHYRKSDRPLKSWVVCFTSCFSPSPFIIGRVTATFSFVCAVMPGEHFLVAMTSNFSPSCHCINRVLQQEPGMVVTVEGISTTLHSDASGPFILHWLHVRTSSSPGFGLVHCNVRVCSMHICLVPRIGLHRHQCVSVW